MNGAQPAAAQDILVRRRIHVVEFSHHALRLAIAEALAGIRDEAPERFVAFRSGAVEAREGRLSVDRIHKLPGGLREREREALAPCVKPVLRLAPARLELGAGLLETGHARRARDGVNLADHRVRALALPHVGRRLGILPPVHGGADRQVLLAPDADVRRTVANARERALLRGPGEVPHVAEAPPGENADENKTEIFHVAKRLFEHLVRLEVEFAPGTLYAGEPRIGEIGQEQRLVAVLKARYALERAVYAPRECVVAPTNRVERRLGRERLRLPDTLLHTTTRRNLRKRVGRNEVETRAEIGGDGLRVAPERPVFANNLLKRRHGRRIADVAQRQNRRRTAVYNGHILVNVPQRFLVGQKERFGFVGRDCDETGHRLLRLKVAQGKDGVFESVPVD